MFKPLNARALVRPDPIPTATASGIIVVDGKEEPPRTGVVVVGNTLVGINDHIVFSSMGWDEVEVNGEKMYLVSEAAILGIF